MIYDLEILCECQFEILKEQILSSAQLNYCTSDFEQFCRIKF